MNRFIRWYNKNRKMFWIVIIITIMAISLPRALNEYAKNNKNTSSSINNTTTYNNKDYSVISGENVKKETNTENNNLINNFIEYCNNGETEKAYNTLSNECKNILYPTLEEFENKYYNKIFENKKSYQIQAWFSNENYNTYKINLKEDILATGNANSPSIEDYYTVVYKDNDYKLNINNYIGNIEINKSNEKDKIKMSVLNKDVFMDYEIYNISVENETGKTILLDSLTNTNTMYLEDSNKLHYDAYSHEIVKEELRVRAVKDINIKFNKKYTTEREITQIVFSDIILDFDNYNTYSNKEEYKERITYNCSL